MKRLSKAQAIKQRQEFYWDQKKADRPEQFFTKFLRHTKGEFAGQNFTPLDWQSEMLSEMFGWQRVEDDTRRYRTAYISTAKKQGKSCTLAAIALYLTIADGEIGNETYSVAADVNQANIVFREAQLMTLAHPELSKIMKINKTQKNIACPNTSSFYRVLPGDGFRVEGINGNILFDELHVQRNRLLFDSLRWAGSARRQPWFIAATTAGYDKNSVCYEMYKYAKNVIRDWSYDPSFLPVLHEVDEQANWEDPKEWPKANPSWNVTIKPKDFEVSFREAKQSLSQENSFRRYRLNQWVAQETRFLNMDHWDACSKPPRESLAGKPCWVGLDLATTFDTSAMVAVFMDKNEDGERTYDCLCRFWIPGENAREREIRDRVPYMTWEKEKSNGLTFTEGNVCDYDKIRADINEFGKQYNVKSIFIDRWNANQLSVQLADDGFNIAGFSQGMAAMSAPTKLLENLVSSGRLRHNGNKILTSHAGNVSVRTDPAGNIRPVKPSKNSVQRVDGIVALIMGLAGASTQSGIPSPTPSILVV